MNEQNLLGQVSRQQKRKELKSQFLSILRENFFFLNKIYEVLVILKDFEHLTI